jgi:ribA/ribD-fused uncharacterized protein
MITDFRDQYFFLSNFFPFPVKYEGVLYPSNENAYQAAKSVSPKVREKFLAIKAGQAKRFGRNITIRPDWEEVKEGIMLELNRAKFANPFLRGQLKSTGEEKLIEGNNWGDKEWGCVMEKGEWVGHNKLGKILMQVRDEI